MKQHRNIDLFILVLLVILINIPLLTGATPIAWDSFKTPYEEFSITYNSVFFNHQIPYWLPFSNFGIPNFFLFSALTIVSFLFIGIGKIFQIQNILLLFKISLIGEQLISVFGMFLLANQLFRKRTTILMVCFAYLANFAIYRQIQLNFRITYLLPFVLYWLILFFRRKAPEYFWLTGLTVFFSVPGCAYYPMIIVFYSVAIFAAVLFLADMDAWKALFTRSWKNLLAFIGFLVAAGVFLYYFKTFEQGIGIMREGREAGLTVPVAVFLSNSVSFDPLTLAGSFLYGIIPFEFTNFYEYVFYIGLVPLAGVIAAALYQRSRAFLAVTAAGFFLYAISLGGYLSFALYYLPYIDLSHYVAALGSVTFRAFFILAAGFGLDLDLSTDQWKKIGVVLLSACLIIDVLGVISAPANPESESGFIEVLMNPPLYTMDFKFFIIRLAAYGLFALLILILFRLKENSLSKHISIPSVVNIGLLVILVFDLGLFRFNFEQKIQVYLHRQMEQVQYLPTLEPPAYQEERLPSPIEASTQQTDYSTSALQSFNEKSLGGYLMESFISFDRCVPDTVKSAGKFEVYTSSLAPLIKNDLVFTSPKNAPEGLKQIFGCEFPKMRVLTDVIVGETDAKAISAIKDNADFSNLLILSGEQSHLQTNLNNPLPDASIEMLNFSANSLKVKVDLDQESGWLVYSDHNHPEWRARVNGEDKTIEKAYLAFKAIPLSKGTNIVELDYGSPLMRFGYTTLAMLCGIAALALFIWLIVVLFSPSENSWLRSDI